MEIITKEGEKIIRYTPSENQDVKTVNVAEKLALLMSWRMVK